MGSFFFSFLFNFLLMCDDLFLSRGVEVEDRDGGARGKMVEV